MTTKVYISDNEDLELLMHNDILGFTFDVKNEDGSNYDFSGLTDLFLKIYDSGNVQTRTNLLVTIPKGVAGVDVAGNVVTWNSTYSTDIAIFKSKKYYYELSYLDANGKLITIVFGNLIVK